MRVDVIVIFEPALELIEHDGGAGTRVAANVVAFERLDERFRHPVGLWASYRGEACGKSELTGEVDRVAGCVTAPIVGEPFQPVRNAVGTKAPFDRQQHHIANHLLREAHRARGPGDYFAIASVHREGDRYNFTVPAMDFEPIGAPTRVRTQGLNHAVVYAIDPLLKQQVGRS